MAFFDWNHNGKKDWQDDYIEYNIYKECTKDDDNNNYSSSNYSNNNYSNNSGCGGAALSRRCFGEHLYRINTRYPYWFCENFHKYKANEAALPFDQHELLALIAPRPLYVASASEDLWADPKGEMLSLVHASPVYGLYGFEPFISEELPAVNTPVVTERLGYHLRQGTHDILLYDWQQYVSFADKFFK